MKHTGFACLAAFALSVLAALPFAGCGKQDAASAGSAGTATSNAVFDKTVAPLELGGVAFSYTDGAAINEMVGKMFDSFDGLIPDDPIAKKIMGVVRSSIDEFGLKAVLGCGTSVKKTGDYYRIRDFQYAPAAGRKGLIWDLSGNELSNGPAPELKLTSPDSALAFTIKNEPGALYVFVDKKLRSALDEEIMAAIDQQISALHSSGIQPDKLLECISAFTFYVEAKEIKEEDLQGVLAGEDVEGKIAGLVPKFALILTTKSDLCWKALENFISQSSPELVKDGKIVPVDGIAIFQAGNYLVATNDEAAIRDRIAGTGSDLTANAEFAKMLALADKDFSSFSYVSEEYFKMIAGITTVFGAMASNVTGGAVPATDPASLAIMSDFHATLATTKIDAEGLMFTTVTKALPIALLNSGTVAGFVSGLLPYIGPFAKGIMDNINNSDDMDFGTLERQTNATAAFAMLKDAKIPEGSVFFALGEEGELVFAKWNETAKELTVVDSTYEDEVPFTILVSPEAAAKAEKPEETVVFYEDPTEFFDGIFVVFGNGEVKFLEGDFEDHSEAMEAAANTFGLSDKAAADLLKKAAAIDKLFAD